MFGLGHQWKFVPGLDLPGQDLVAALESGTYTEKVREDLLGGVRSNVTGVPTFFLNGGSSSICSCRSFVSWYPGIAQRRSDPAPGDRVRLARTRGTAPTGHGFFRPRGILRSHIFLLVDPQLTHNESWLTFAAHAAQRACCYAANKLRPNAHVVREPGSEARVKDAEMTETIPLKCPRCGLEARYVVAEPGDFDRIEVVGNFTTLCQVTPKPRRAIDCLEFQRVQRQAERQAELASPRGID